MLRIIGPSDPGRAEAEQALLDRMSLVPAEVERDVRAIVEAVRARGDAAVREYTERFEKRTLDGARAVARRSGSASVERHRTGAAGDRARGRSHRALPCAAARRRLSLRGGRRAAGAARAAARARRALRAGRKRALSVVGPDDGGAGAHRGRARDRDGDARPIGGDAAGGEGGGRASRVRHRRGAGGGGAGVRYGDPCRASTRSSGRATRGWPRPSGSCSGRWTSTPSPGRRRSW